MRVRLLDICDPYFHTRCRRRRRRPRHCCCCCCCLEFLVEASLQMMARKFKHVLEVCGKSEGQVMLC